MLKTDIYTKCILLKCIPKKYSIEDDIMKFVLCEFINERKNINSVDINIKKKKNYNNIYIYFDDYIELRCNISSQIKSYIYYVCKNTIGNMAIVRAVPINYIDSIDKKLIDDYNKINEQSNDIYLLKLLKRGLDSNINTKKKISNILLSKFHIMFE